MAAATPAIALHEATIGYDDRPVIDAMDLRVDEGEVVGLLGPNGSGKTSLLKVLLGQNSLSSGTATIDGEPVKSGGSSVGYIPQQKAIDESVPLRGRDFVGLGWDGHRWGIGLRERGNRRKAVDAAIESVSASGYAGAPLGTMSGGEQQRLRVAQALVGNPSVLLCDEPLLSLDLANQQVVAQLIDQRRRAHDTSVVFVTHEINPILPVVDRIVYIVDGKFRIGTTDEVMTSEVLSELYDTEVEVLRIRDRLIVVGTGDAMDALGSAGGHHVEGHE